MGIVFGILVAIGVIFFVVWIIDVCSDVWDGLTKGTAYVTEKKRKAKLKETYGKVLPHWVEQGFNSFDDWNKWRYDELAKNFNAFTDALGRHFKNFGPNVTINNTTFTADGYGWYVSGDLKFAEELDQGTQCYYLGPIELSREEFLTQLNIKRP